MPAAFAVGLHDPPNVFGDLPEEIENRVFMAPFGKMSTILFLYLVRGRRVNRSAKCLKHLGDRGMCRRLGQWQELRRLVRRPIPLEMQSLAEEIVGPLTLWLLAFSRASDP